MKSIKTCITACGGHIRHLDDGFSKSGSSSSALIFLRNQFLKVITRNLFQNSMSSNRALVE
jgi:hypothetical protein